MQAANDNTSAQMKNAMIDWQLRGALQESGLRLKVTDNSVDVLDEEECPWAHFVGPFAKLNALRFLNTYTLGGFHA